MIKGYEAFIMQSNYHKKKIILSLKLYLTHIHPTLKKTFHTLSASNYYVSFMLSSA